MSVMMAILAAAGTHGQEAQTGRPVRVTSIGFSSRPLERILALVEQEGARGTDLIILPEACTGQEHPETLDGPTITSMCRLAKAHRTYIICPIDRQDGPRRLNTAVLVDREGKVACTYDKVFPFWSEFDLKPPVDVGDEVPVFQADFGRLGMAICFDANYPEVWQRLADQGAELVAWSSAYSAGTSLQAHAINHHYYVVSSTWRADCLIYDLTGECLRYERKEDVNITRVALDLDRCIFHDDFNIPKRDKLLREHADEVEQDKRLEREAWFVLRARRPGVSARALAQEYGLEELRDYIARSRFQIDQKRRWSFREKVGREQDSALQQRFRSVAGGLPEVEVVDP